MEEKPHKGRILNWFKTPCNSGLGYYIIGTFLDHPQLAGKETNTSWVEQHDETTGEIETRNSRYKLLPNKEP